MKVTRSTVLILISLLFETVQVNSQGNNFAWAKDIGGQFDESVSGIATDANGNIYTTGNFQGTVDFDPGSGASNLTSNGSSDIFIHKLSANGTFAWARSLGSVSNDYGYSISIDNNGDVLITGSFQGTVNFNPSGNPFNLTSAGDNDIFIEKLDASGNFIWAEQFGGSGSDAAYSISSDVNGNIVATGYFEGTADFDPGAGISNLGAVGLYDIFVLKINSTGGFVWAKNMGGVDYDFGYGVATDPGGNVYTTGFFKGINVDFDPGAGITYFTSGNRDIYIQKLDPSGNFVWAKQMGGFGDDIGYGILIGAGGSIYTTGSFQNVVDFDPGANTFTVTTTGGGYTDDIYVQKLDAGGNFVWAKNYGGSSDDRGYSIAKDQHGSIYTTGYHSGSGDFDPGAPVFNLTGDGTFIEKLDSNGIFIWAKEMAKSQGNAIASDATGNLFTAGGFDHTVDFDPGPGQTNLMSNAGTLDAYIQKLSASTVGINENPASIFIYAYPNPTTGLFTITLNRKYAEINIEITDVTGKLLYTEKASDKNSVVINLNENNYHASFTAGCYFVSVSCDNLKQCFMVAKQ